MDGRSVEVFDGQTEGNPAVQSSVELPSHAPSPVRPPMCAPFGGARITGRPEVEVTRLWT
ncbi:hypothetical protein CSW53_19580 [Rhodococcus ruber]|nr:hypothetical protein CSW53_19580 [Rhodococcus ruber]